MGTYDYRSYFQTLISNQTTIISNQNTILLFIQVFIFLFTIYFLYKLISKMTRGRY